ncbi:MAG: hypothetical protein RLZZ327_182 [Actinomycetota bacterium]|jgi:hypothetical protein
MLMMWGLLIAMVGVLFVWWGRSKSEFVVYRLLVARSRVLWGSGDRVHGFYQCAGAALVVFGAVLAIAV